MDLKMRSQLGRPKEVSARRPVMASAEALWLLIMMLVASSVLIFAVRYCLGVRERVEEGGRRGEMRGESERGRK